MILRSMGHLTNRIFLLLLVGILTACSTLPTPEPVDQEAMFDFWEMHRADMLALNSYTLEGRAGVRTADEGANFTVYWQQHQDTFNIRLSGPLGQGGATLSGGDGWAEMRTSDGTVRAESLDELMAQTTELNLPLDLLRYWVRGIPAPDLTAGIELNSVPLLVQMEQAGWSVEYTEYYPDSGLPRRMNIRQGERSARIIIQTWDLSGA